MVRTLDLWLAVAGSNPGHDTAWYFWNRWPYFAGKLSWGITTTQINSASHPSGVAKSSTSFGWGKDGKVTSAGWQVTLCDLIWHVISRSGVVISITNCYIRFTYLLTYLRRSRSGKVINFNTNGKSVCNFILVNNTDSHPFSSYGAVLVRLSPLIRRHLSLMRWNACLPNSVK